MRLAISQVMQIIPSLFFCFTMHYVHKTLKCIGRQQTGIFFTLEHCCVRCRDKALYIYIPSLIGLVSLALLYIIPNLFAYFLTCLSTSFILLVSGVSLIILLDWNMDWICGMENGMSVCSDS